jgi:ABC-2 type transport system permease protein
VKILSIAGVNLRRTLRERTNLFFVFIFPMLLILVLGVAFGGEFTPRVGLVVQSGDPLARELADQLRAADGIDVRAVDDADAVVAGVERGELEAAVVIPADYDRAVRAGRTTEVRYVLRPGQQGQQIGSIISAVVDEQSGLLRAARFTEQEAGVSFDEGRRRAEEAAAAVPLATVSMSVAGESDDAALPEGRFDTGASSQLLVFLFITALTGAAALIESRRVGVSRRMLATPTPSWQIVAGEGLGRFSVAAVQAIVIMVGSALLFGVDWGDPVGAAVLTIAFGLVATGAGLLMGAVARSTEQATAVGLLVGLGMAALGGTMMPLEFFPSTMRLVAHGTPHAWAVDGFTELVRHGGTLGDILVPVAVLLAAAAVLLALASWQLRRSIAR